MFNRKFLFIGGGAVLFCLSALQGMKETYDLSDPQEYTYLGAYLLPSFLFGMLVGYVCYRLFGE